MTNLRESAFLDSALLAFSISHFLQWMAGKAETAAKLWCKDYWCVSNFGKFGTKLFYVCYF